MALFRDIEDFAQLAPALSTASWSMLEPSVDLVEKQFLRDEVLGATLYDDLLQAYKGSIASPVTPLSPQMQALLDRCRPAIAGLAAHQAMPKLGVLITTGGPMVSQTDTMRPASQWRIRAAAKTLFQEGLSYLDQLIAFLLEHDDYSWNSSPFAVSIRSCLVRTVQEFSPYQVNIGNSGWMLHRLRPAMRHVQERIRGIICQDAYNDLVAAVNAGPVTGANAAILAHARPAIIYLAIAESATGASITMDPDGVWTWQSTSAGDSGGGPVNVQDKRLDRAIELYAQRGEEHLKAIRKAAQDLAAAGQYPLYLNSACYQATPPTRDTTPEGSSTFSSL